MKKEQMKSVFAAVLVMAAAVCQAATGVTISPWTTTTNPVTARDGMGAASTNLVRMAAALNPSGLNIPQPEMFSKVKLQEFFQQETRSLLSSNRFYFSAGIPGEVGYSPSLDVYAGYLYLRDLLAALQAVPDAFNANTISNWVKLFAAHTVTNLIPDAIDAQAVPFVPPRGASYDATYDWVSYMYAHYQKFGSPVLFTNLYATITNCDAHVPITNHLVATAGQGYGDILEPTGYELTYSLRRFRAYNQLGDMAAAAGWSAVASNYFNELPSIRANLKTYLWDDARGLFRNAQGVETNHQVFSSAEAVLIGATDDDTANKIVQALIRGAPGGVDAANGKGYFFKGGIRFWPKDENASGGYQSGGYWPEYCGLVVEAIALHDPRLALRMQSELVTNTVSQYFTNFYTRKVEWFSDFPSDEPGQDNYLMSCGGQVLRAPNSGKWQGDASATDLGLRRIQWPGVAEDYTNEVWVSGYSGAFSWVNTVYSFTNNAWRNSTGQYITNTVPGSYFSLADDTHFGPSGRYTDDSYGGLSNVNPVHGSPGNWGITDDDPDYANMITSWGTNMVLRFR